MPLPLFPSLNKEWHGPAFKRFGSPFTGTPFGRIDFDPIMLSHTAKIFGHTIKDFYMNPDLGIALVAYANELYDCLPVSHWFYANVWVRELGAKLVYKELLPPIIEAPVVKEPEDADKIEVLGVDEIAKGPTATEYFKAYDYMKENIPQMLVPIAWAFDVLGNAAGILGVDKFLLWTIKQRKICHVLLKKATDTSANGAIAIAKRYGSAMLGMGSVLGNTDLFPPAGVKEFSFDYIQKYVRQAIRGGGGPQLFYHLCGNHSRDYPIFKDLILSPLSVLNIGYDGKETFSAKKMKEEFGDKHTIMPSVDTTLMLRGTTMEVYEAAKKQLLEGRDSPRGFVMGTACEVPPDAPPANIFALRKACEDFGKYGTW